MAPLPKNESSVSVGVGVASGDEKDRARFGMFNGLRKHDVNGLVGFTYFNNDAEAGRWLTIEGRNLALDNRELGFSYRKLGDMKFTADYSEITRHDPRTINTSLSGAGTTTPSVSFLATPGTGSELNLELKRKALGFNLEKRFGDFQVEVAFKNEDKDGSRFWGRGFACSTAWQTAGVCSNTTGGALLMLPEPVDSTIRQLDAKLNYSGERLKLSGGYYGNFYTNRVGSLRPTLGRLGGALGNQFGNENGGLQAADAALNAYMQTPMALWPDSQAHQLFLGGNYLLTSHTRLNFKYSYTHATQNEGFGGMGLTGAPAGQGDLGGVLDWTKAQLGFSSHPMDKLHVHGDVTYDYKHNRTPVAYYNIEGVPVPPPGVAPVPGVNPVFTNGNQSPKKYDVKLEASYRLPQEVLLVGGIKYEHEDFGPFTQSVSVAGLSGLKQKLDETGYRVELRKTMSETLTGSLSYVTERRTGQSPWLKPLALPATGVIDASGDCASVGANACVYSRTAIFPFIFMDRERDKVRFMSNWTPMERLSLQLYYDNGRDLYHGPTEHGLRSSRLDTLSLDASYAFSDKWRGSAYVSQGRQKIDSGHSTGYDAQYKDTSKSAGLGFAGTPLDRLRLGGDLTWIYDRLIYQQLLDPSNTSAGNTFAIASGGLPDVTYRLTRLNLYGEFAVQKNAYVRVDYIHHQTFFNEWTYGYNGLPFLYSDNTTLTAQEKQKVDFVGVSYVYKFQ